MVSLRFKDWRVVGFYSPCVSCQPASPSILSLAPQCGVTGSGGHSWLFHGCWKFELRFIPTELSSSPQHKFLTSLSPPPLATHPGFYKKLHPQKVTTYMGLPRASGELAKSSSSTSSWSPEAGPIVKDKGGRREGVRDRGGQW